MNEYNEKLNNIKKTYDNLTYLDQYGLSVISFVIITIILLLIISYFNIMSNIQPIVDDWTNQRCNPFIIPFAGYITHPEGVSAFDYTYQNFNYCTQNVLSGVTSHAIQPLTYITNVLQSITNDIQSSIQNIRSMFDKIRTSFQNVTEEIMGRLMNVTISLMQIIIEFKDLMGKAQGAMTGGLFTLLGSYYTLKSLMGAIAQFIIMILIALASMIAGFWLFPFTWGAAIANTTIFMAIAIPMAIILSFMTQVLHVKSNLQIPKVKCFDKNTLLKMKDGTFKKIINIQIGDILENNNIITSKIAVTCENSIIYQIDNILVSDSHILHYNGNWITVSKHPKAIKVDNYDNKYLYCLNTTEKTIKIGNYVFTDWDEIYGYKLEKILQINYNNIHKYNNYGFKNTTEIMLQNGKCKQIDKIKINDVLKNGDKVYGIVEIDGKTLVSQFKYQFNNLCIEGFIPMLKEYTIKNEIKKNYKLYNLLTDSGKFEIHGMIFYDYNMAIDRLL